MRASYFNASRLIRGIEFFRDYYFLIRLINEQIINKFSMKMKKVIGFGRM
jgi:hypothetical protein